MCTLHNWSNCWMCIGHLNLKVVFLFHGLLVPQFLYLFIYFECLFVCIQYNVKTTEPIGSQFCPGPHVTPGKVYDWSKFQKLASNKIGFSLNFEHSKFRFFKKSASFLFVCFVLQCRYTKRKCSQLKLKMSMKRPESLIYIN